MCTAFTIYMCKRIISVCTKACENLANANVPFRSFISLCSSGGRSLFNLCGLYYLYQQKRLTNLRSSYWMMSGNHLKETVNFALWQMPRALCGWTCPQRWWKAAPWCYTVRWTVTLLPGSHGCLEKRRLCGTQRPTYHSLWMMWRLSGRAFTPVSGKMTMEPWTLHCTWP